MRPDREQAIELRKQGKTYGEISTVLGVPKSTLSGWLADIGLPNQVRDRIARRARRAWAKNITAYNRARGVAARDDAGKAQRSAAQAIGDLTRRELQLIGASLYWAEGSKKDRWKLVLTNSDPALIRLMMRFFREVCAVPDSRITLRLHVHENISADAAKKHWSRVTGIPLTQFQKTQTAVSRGSRGRRNPTTLPYGTLHVMVHDTRVVNDVKGWMQGIGRRT